jgi:hypothetical protein
MSTSTHHRRRTLAGLVLALAASGCTSLLGDFGTGGTEKDAAVTVHPDASGSSSGGSSSGSSGGVTDAQAEDDASDAAAPPPPPVPGKPGFDLTVGGNTSVSNNYKLIGSVGEGPGGNVVGHSTNFTLKGGVVAGTQ